MDSSHRSSQAVPTKRPLLLKELSRAVPGVDDRVRELDEGAAPGEYEVIADGLWSVFLLTRELAPTRSRTGCDVHPDGPVDPLAPPGWTRCLLCNRNRRISDPASPSAEASAGPATAGSGYAVPPPPYTRDALTEAVRRVTGLTLDLDYESPDAEFTALADRTHAAFVIARELSRPRAAATCPRHPGAPVDPTAEETGGSACLFCRGEETRRGSQGPPVPRGRMPRSRRRIGRRFGPPPGGGPRRGRAPGAEGGPAPEERDR
ncbi:hypothetical protein [Streptomyces sp. TR06-5]|uniref:hypothetical protein n=1 Tax=unclassified Streptomyces TaxID=2593676 RepID=UPI0039A312DD